MVLFSAHEQTHSASCVCLFIVHDGLFLVFSYSTKYGPQDFNVRM